ncbi:MAG: FAD-dependent oxidoreductase [Acidobacteriaceae bacterium]
MRSSRITDVVVAGGGIIGLSIALELRQRGLSVVVLERAHAMRSASWAAGGMLAGRDPETPPALLPLALRSLELYPEYLDRIETLSGECVPLRTRRTLLQPTMRPGTDTEAATAAEMQLWIPGLNEAARNFIWLDEDSLDPRDLCRALPTAFQAAGGSLLEDTAVLEIESRGTEIAVKASRERGTGAQIPIHAGFFVNCCGAWAGQPLFGEIPVAPVKGQMVTVALDANRLRCVLRTPNFYAIPRGDGRVTVGATVEHAGFDQAVEEEQLTGILRTAAQMLPEIELAPRLESWAGLRPGTPDELPILGRAEADRCWHAAGHYRNGILLAPATARMMAQAILGEPTDVPLQDFSPSRFRSWENPSKSPQFAASHSSR